jgi:hypothetical protein
VERKLKKGDIVIKTRSSNDENDIFIQVGCLGIVTREKGWADCDWAPDKSKNDWLDYEFNNWTESEINLEKIGEI